MGFVHDMGSRFATAGELLAFLWRRKLWWMIPLVFILVMLGLLITFGTSSGLGPVIYPLF